MRPILIWASLLAMPFPCEAQDTLRLQIGWDTIPGVSSYDWELLVADESVASGKTTLSPVTHLLPILANPCVTARVRATDIGYSSPPPWGWSDTLCVELRPPPAPANVTLDTVATSPPTDSLVASHDWAGLETPDLPALRIFWNNVYHPDGSVETSYTAPVDSGNVEVVSDPTFGQVVRIRQNPVGTNFSTPQGTVQLGAPYLRLWYRLYMKFAPGYQGGGYKMAFLRQHLRIQGDGGGTGTTYGVPNYFGYPEEGTIQADRIDGSEGRWHLGYVDAEWDDGQWQELVLYADLRGVPVRFGAWRRTVSPDIGPWKHLVVEYDRSYDGTGIAECWMGANINIRPAAPQYVSWGPWEVWDAGDPWGLLHYFDRL